MATPPSTPLAAALSQADLLAGLGRIDDAIRTLRAAQADSGPDAHLCTHLAALQHRAGQLPEAVATLRRALALDPDHAEAALLLCVCLCDAGQYEAGREVHQALRQRDRMDQGLPRPFRTSVAERLSEAATLLADAGELDQAIAEYRRALRWNPSDQDLRLKLARTQLRHGDPQGAIDVLTGGEAPPTSRTLAWLAVCKTLLNAPDASLRDADAALLSDPQQRVARSYRRVAAAMLG